VRGKAATAVTDGLVVVDKPAGCTSHDVVARCRKIFGQRSVGHAGTLDPDATGVLLVGLGRATRLLRFVQEADKAYTAVVRFGVATDTLDAAGAVVAEKDMAELTLDSVRAAALHFVGEIEQIPPMVSALKVGGRRLHELAREGVEVERAPRPVRIDSIDVESLEPGLHPEALVHVTCGTGTYIRSLAADLGAALSGYAHIATLRRTRVGSFTVEAASALPEVEARNVALVLSPAEMVRALPSVTVDATTASAVAHGATFATRDLLVESDVATRPVAVLDAAGDLLAVYEPRAGSDGRGMKPAVVVRSAS
jgi:tRNA pseudouridine55 synthase